MGVTPLSVTALAAVVILACVQPSIAASNVTCSDSLHMIVARASTEPPGEGIIGTVASSVANQISGATSEAVKYPATLGYYMSSETDGVNGMEELIMQYADACPGGKMALLGYSQGAQVVGDVLCGHSEDLFNKSAPLASNYTKNIVAAIQMGDPSFVPGLPWDRGTSNTAGIFPRQNTSACKPYASIIRSYCDKNDLYCASGNSVTVHYEYTINYGSQAVDFIVAQYKAAAGSASGSTTTASTTASSTETTMTMTMTGGTMTGTTMATGVSGAGATTSTSTGLAGHAAPPAAPGWFAAALIALLL